MLLVSPREISHSVEAAAGAAPVAPARRGRGPTNTNDVFCPLGPDSQPMDGAPKGNFSAPKVIPNHVFPHTQPAYSALLLSAAILGAVDPAQPANATVNALPTPGTARASRRLAADLGLFEDHGDVGATKRAGSVEFDAGRRAYAIAGGGANMWFTNDALHYLWKKVTGDVTLAADIVFEGQGGDPHRKACLLVRQSLEADSAYADAALHGDGLTSLQYRAAQNERTYEIQSGVTGPKRLRIEKRGRYVSLSIADESGELRPAGGSFRLDLTEPFYIGLGVCAHNNEVLEKAVFSNVELTTGSPAQGQPRLISTLETVPLASKDRRVVWTTPNLIEAPNWSHDGASLLFNSRGHLHRIPVAGGKPQSIDTGFATRCTSNHGISPDGATLVISDPSQGDRKSRLYTLPITGGTPKLITEAAPSYWHGWSPDGRTLAYSAERNGEFDIYTIPVGGGAETRLTSCVGTVWCNL